MIDWIELIPFAETRNYIQRVVENVAVYRAREGVVRPYPVKSMYESHRTPPRHCEEQRDEAVQARGTVLRAWIATPAKQPARDDGPRRAFRPGQAAGERLRRGYVPPRPGTAGSLLATIAGAGLMRLPTPVLPAAVAAASLAGLWAVRRASGGADAGWVVIDEVAGQWLALSGLARPRLTGLAAAFALFRILDVAKPGPVGWADRQAGAAAVMGDDLIAGALTAGVLLGGAAAVSGGAGLIVSP